MDEENLIVQGKALVMAIQGLLALDEAKVEISVIERHMRPQLVRNYRRKLKEILSQVPSDMAGEILMGMKNINLPSNNPSLN